jgi:hypothetical protein
MTFLQFAVWAVCILIFGGCFAVVYGDRVKGPIGSDISDWAIRAMFLGFVLALVLMIYLANAPVR